MVGNKGPRSSCRLPPSSDKYSGSFWGTLSRDWRPYNHPQRHIMSKMSSPCDPLLHQNSPRQRKARPSKSVSRSTSISLLSSLILTFAILLLFLVQPASAVKFKLIAERYPQPKCIWNAAHENVLVVVTANVGPGQYPSYICRVERKTHADYLSPHG